MKAVALHPSRKTSRPADSAGFVEWLDALSSRSCTEDEVLAYVQRREETDRDTVWECLAQLDQQFRRKRISQELFASLKSRLQQHSLGMRGNVPAGGGSRAKDAAVAPQPAQSVPPVSRPRERPSTPAPPPAPSMRAPDPAARAGSAKLPDAAAIARNETLRATPSQLAQTSHPAPRLQLRVGDVLRGRYRLVDVISEDDSGVLYEALDEINLGLPGARPRVAIRVIANDPSRLPERLRRLSRVQALSHPGIVRVFNVDEERGSVFVTMELPSGASLRQVLDQTHSPLPTAAALKAVRSVAAGLLYAHSQGVHHGDVRAEHVYLNGTLATNAQIYDTVGRTYTAGLRFRL